MRCLYCGKELALLKRLTGGGEFCSEGHKQSYQEEYNRLALSRLLQAQAKTSDGKTAQKPPPGRTSTTPVAVEEPAEAPVSQSVTTNPPEAAGFFMSRPVVAFPTETPLYLEQWLDISAPPTNPEWHFSAAVHVPDALQGLDDFANLPEGQLLRLETKLAAQTEKLVIAGTNVAPEEFQTGKPNLRLPIAKAVRDIPSAGPIALEVRPRPLDGEYSTSVGAAMRWRTEVVFRKSVLLDRLQAKIEFPAADGDVVFAAEAEPETAEPDAPVASVEGPVPEATTVEAAEPEPEQDTPRAALKALSKLHQDLKGHEQAPELEQAPQEEPPTPEPAVTVISSNENPETPAQHAPPIQIVPERETAVSSGVQGSQGGIADLIEIPLKTLAPPKPALLVDANALLTLAQPILPGLKGLPLRPKMAMAPPGFAAAPKSGSTRNPITEAKMKAASIPPKPRPEEKTNPPSQPPVVELKPPPPEPPAGKAEKATPAVKTSEPPQVPRKSQPDSSSSIKQPPQPPAPPAAPAAKPTARDATWTSPSRKEETATKPAPPSSTEPTLSFETLQLQLMENTKTSFWGSLKVKLIIAILLVVGVIAGYLGFGSKPHKQPGTAATSSDGPGPSIMVGEGGWVQGWAGDTQGAHGGRQITIYRPSLKLADYRIEFQGQIETKSLGWVFRAADPDNYYAMKLAFVSTGLPLKAALIKYMIFNGRETELGRIPLDLSVTNDTTFNIRMDVRGPRFNTYIQGQQVDVWTNDQLKTGGVGFLNERSERGKIKSVSISYLQGGDK